MKITPELVAGAPQLLNPLGDRQMTLRGTEYGRGVTKKAAIPRRSHALLSPALLQRGAACDFQA